MNASRKIFRIHNLKTEYEGPDAMTTHAQSLQDRPVYIVDGARTPFIKARGKPGPFTPVDLAVLAGQPLLLRQDFNPQTIDEVILGCVNPHQDEVNPGRVAALRLGCGDSTPGWTVQRNCGSGMQSVDTAFRYIADGQADLILAGGTEALSHAPLIYRPEFVTWLGEWQQATSIKARAKLLGNLRPGFFKPIIGLVRGLTDPICDLNMGQTAEVLAHQFDISREAADRYAVQSHKRLAAAQEEGRLAKEIEVMIDKNGHLYDHDNGVRKDNSKDKLAKLSPAFEKPYGNVTAGNSSQITDGACWLLLASEAAVEKHRLQPLARIKASHWSALNPKVMGLGPVFSIDKLLKQSALSKDDIAMWEINEAFAAQVLACQKAWQDEEFCRDYLQRDTAFGEIDEDKLNVDGGAISLGHPVGTSGARIVLHAINALRQKREQANTSQQPTTKLNYAVASECIGGGQGGAMLLEAC